MNSLVIFDTGTRPEYARDVHTVLALPADSVVRYEYRDQYFTEEAEALLQRFDTAIPALLCYAQDREYRRGYLEPADPIEEARLLWTPTRWAELVWVYKDGDRWHLNLALRGYPLMKPDLDAVRAQLVAAGSIPFAKWIAVADIDAGIFNAEEDAAGAWREICAYFSTPPSLFSNDCFWRISRVESGRKRLAPTIDDHRQKLGGIVVGRWHVKESGDLRIGIESTRSAGRIPGRECMVVSSTHTEAPMTLSNSQVRLRGYAHNDLSIETHHLSAIRGVTSVLQLSSPSENDWPSGPDLQIPVYVEKRVSWIYLGIAFLVLAAFLGLAAKGAADTDRPLDALIALFGAVAFGLLGGALLTGKIGVFKP